MANDQNPPDDRLNDSSQSIESLGSPTNFGDAEEDMEDYSDHLSDETDSPPLEIEIDDSIDDGISDDQPQANGSFTIVATTNDDPSVSNNEPYGSDTPTIQATNELPAVNLNKEDLVEASSASTRIELNYFQPYARDNLIDVQQEYVETNELRKFIDEHTQSTSDESNRVFAIIGTKNSGRRTTAIRLAMALIGKRETAKEAVNQIYEYDTSGSSMILTVADIIRKASEEQISTTSDNITQEVVVIVNVASETTGSIFSKNQLTERVKERLRRFQCRVICIVNTEYAYSDRYKKDFGNIASYSTVQENNINSVKVMEQRGNEVFTQHRDLTFPDTDAAILVPSKIRETLTDKSTIKTILSHLQRPGQIPAFFRRCIDEELDDKAHAIDIAIDIETKWQNLKPLDTPQKVRNWFRGLNTNHQLYVMLATLLYGIDFHMLDEIYDHIIQRLREQGIHDYDDPRKLNAEEMREAVHLVKGSFSLNLEFRGDSIHYRSAILDEVSNYHRLWWSVIDILLTKLYTSDNQTDSEIQTKSGHNDKSRLASEIQQISNSRNDGQKQTAQYTNDETTDLTVQLEQVSPIEDTNTELTDNAPVFYKRNETRNKRRRRIIASCVAHIGSYRIEKLKIVIDHITNFDKQEARESVIEILNHLLHDIQYHDFVQDILNEWRFRNTNNKYNYDGLILGIKAIPELYLNLHEFIAKSGTTTQDSKDIMQQTAENLLKSYEKICNVSHQFDTLPLLDYATQVVSDVLDANNINFNDLPPESKNEIETQRKDLFVALHIARHDDLVVAIIDGIEKIVERAPHGIIISSQETSKSMLTYLKEWLALSDASPRWQIARLAVNSLFKGFEKQISVIDESASHLLNLLPGMVNASLNSHIDMLEWFKLMALGKELRSSVVETQGRRRILSLSDAPIDIAMQAMRRLYTDFDAKNQELWQETVFPAFLRTLNETNFETRQAMIAAIFRKWIRSNSELLYRSGLALLQRAYALNGSQPDIPTSRYGVIVIEPTSRYHSDYLEVIFQLIQRVATLIPIHIYYLGMSPEFSYKVGTFRTPDLIAIDSDGSENFKDINHPISPRAPLLMPLFDPPGKSILSPKDCHFVLVLNRSNIVDLEDLAYLFENELQRNGEVLVDSEQSKASESPLELARKRRQVEQSKATRESQVSRSSNHNNAGELWKNKIIVYKNVPLDGHLSSVLKYVLPNPETKSISTNNIEYLVQHQITQNLYQLDSEDLENEFQIYWDAIKITDQFDILKLIEETPNFLEHNTSATANFDLIRVAIFKVILDARTNLAVAVNTVKNWLTGEHNSVQILGISATLALYRYYSLNISTPTVAHYGILTNLLPSLATAVSSFSDFEPVFKILLNWAQDSEWSQYLISQTEEELPSLIQTLDLLSPKVLANFLQYFQTEKARITAMRDALVQDDNNFIQQREAVENQVWVIDALTLYLDDRLDDQLPELPENHQYILVVIDTNITTDDKKARNSIRQLVLQVMRNVLQKIQDLPHIDKLVPIVQFLGQTQIQYAMFGDIRRQKISIDHNKFWQPSMQNYAPIIGPILEKYPQEKIANILMIVISEVIDLDDWIDDDVWRGRLVGIPLRGTPIDKRIRQFDINILADTENDQLSEYLINQLDAIL